MEALRGRIGLELVRAPQRDAELAPVAGEGLEPPLPPFPALRVVKDLDMDSAAVLRKPA